MKLKYNKKLKILEAEPETALEAIETLEQFFCADMWFAKHAEWKTEDDMINYLERHFKICKDEIKTVRYNLKRPKHDKK
jgi:hypothetical protein